MNIEYYNENFLTKNEIIIKKLQIFRPKLFPGFSQFKQFMFSGLSCFFPDVNFFHFRIFRF